MLVPIKSTRMLKIGDQVLERGNTVPVFVKDILDDEDFIVTNETGTYGACEWIGDFDLVCSDDSLKAITKQEDDRLNALVEQYCVNRIDKYPEDFKPIIQNILKDFAKVHQL